MIFIFFGLCFLIFWSFLQARKNLAATFLKIQNDWAQDQSDSFVKKFLIYLGFVVLSLSPHQTRLTGIALNGRHLWKPRWSLLLISLSSMAVLFWAGLLSFSFQIPGGLLLLAGFCAVIIPKKWSSFISFLWFVFFLGVFLHSLETTLKMGAFLHQELLFQELTFLIADNRLLSVLTWMFVSILITFFIPYEGWSWVFSVLALSMGIMGFSVAMGFIIGENLGASLVFLKLVKKDAPDFFRVALEYFLMTALAAVSFLFIYGFLKSEWQVLSFLGSGTLPEKMSWFLLGALAWSGFATFLTLVWGHFKAKASHSGSMTHQNTAKWHESGKILPTFVQDIFSLSQKQKDQ